MWREENTAIIRQKLELQHFSSGVAALPWLEKSVQPVREQLSAPRRLQLRPLLLSCGRRRGRWPAARHTHRGRPDPAPADLPRHRQDPNWPGRRWGGGNAFPPSMTAPGRRSAPSCRARTSPLRWVQVGSRCPDLICAAQLYARRCTAGWSLSTVFPCVECNAEISELEKEKKTNCCFYFFRSCLVSSVTQEIF